MGIVLQLFLPLSLAIISFSLGLGLVGDDFRRVVERKKVFALGLVVQVFVLPLIAFSLVALSGLTGTLAAGLMLIAFCPGGTTSNLLTRLAKGDVALSISLTAITSLLSVLTVPMMTAWAVAHFMGADAPEVSVAALSIAMFLMSALPVAIGMLIRWRKATLAHVMERYLLKVSGLLFTIIMLAAIVLYKDALMANFGQLGPAVLGLCVVTMGVGLGLGYWLRVSWPAKKAIALELGIQAGVVAITLAGLIEPNAESLPILALPAAVYGVLMYFVAVPFAMWVRNKH